MPIARNVVERVDRRYRSSLWTAPVLDGAVGLLDAWCATAGTTNGSSSTPKPT